MKYKRILREKRKLRIRAKVKGTKAKPRFSVFRSNYALSAQIINDEEGETIVCARTRGKTKKEGRILGEEIAKKALAKKIISVVFDRSGYRYHGVIKEIADAARKGGLQF